MQLLLLLLLLAPVVVGHTVDAFAVVVATSVTAIFAVGDVDAIVVVASDIASIVD